MIEYHFISNHLILNHFISNHIHVFHAHIRLLLILSQLTANHIPDINHANNNCHNNHFNSLWLRSSKFRLLASSCPIRSCLIVSHCVTLNPLDTQHSLKSRVQHTPVQSINLQLAIITIIIIICWSENKCGLMREVWW